MVYSFYINKCLFSRLPAVIDQVCISNKLLLAFWHLQSISNWYIAMLFKFCYCFNFITILFRSVCSTWLSTTDENIKLQWFLFADGRHILYAVEVVIFRFLIAGCMQPLCAVVMTTIFLPLAALAVSTGNIIQMCVIFTHIHSEAFYIVLNCILLLFTNSPS